MKKINNYCYIGNLDHVCIILSSLSTVSAATAFFNQLAFRALNPGSFSLPF